MQRGVQVNDLLSDLLQDAKRVLVVGVPADALLAALRRNEEVVIVCVDDELPRVKEFFEVAHLHE